jgi:hypothetical protein
MKATKYSSITNGTMRKATFRMTRLSISLAIENSPGVFPKRACSKCGACHSHGDANYSREPTIGLYKYLL